MTQPACMTDAEYALWSDNRYAPALSPCLDCPLAFAQAMRAEGCCDGRPGWNGRPRITERLVAYRGRGWKYANAEDRLTARRMQWRDAKRRKAANA